MFGWKSEIQKTKKTGHASQMTWRQDELMGGKPSVVK
jgi:hypothetical protein